METSESEREPLIQSRTYLIPLSKWHYIPGAVVLLIVFLDRLSFYSLTSNFYLFLNQNNFCWTTENSLKTVLLFLSVTYVSCIFGGFIADSVLGRFPTIALGLLLFSLSYFLLPFIHNPNGENQFCSEACFFANLTDGNVTESYSRSLTQEICSSYLLPIIIVAAFGSGCIRTNIVPFGVEQVCYRGPEYTRVYLNWFYWCISGGALVAVLGIGFVQVEQSFFIGLLIPAAFITFATLLFLITYPIYNKTQRSSNAYLRIFHIVKEAYKSKRRFQRNQNQHSSEESLAISPSWLDMAKVQYGGKFHEAAVEDVKSLGTILVVFIFLIPYWILYFQMQTSFQSQGLHMNLALHSFPNSSSCDSNSIFQIPASWLTVFDIMFLFLFIPLMDWFIYPWLDRKGWRIPLMIQMIFGMIIASFSLISAGIVELVRMKLIDKGNIVCQFVENTPYNAANMSIFWQIPQYLFMGISEVFTSITGMEFASSQAPTSLRGVIMGLFYFFSGVGSFINIFIITLINNWDSTWHVKNDINDLKFQCYFFGLAIMQIVFAIIFYFVSLHLKIRRPPRQPSRIYFYNSTASSGNLNSN